VNIPGGETVIADDGCALWCADCGRGTPLVVCHGGPGLWDMFQTLPQSLADGLRMVRWDQRGCGRSERRGPYTVARSVADLDAIRNYLGWGRMALLGHSWGATLALRYALDHSSRVSALVYVSGVGLGWAWREPFEENYSQRLAPHQRRLSELRGRDRTRAEERELAILQWSAEFTDSDGIRHAEQMATPWFEINRECYDAIWAELNLTWREPELRAACRGLAMPVLIIDGEHDVRPRWAVDSLAQALPAAVRAVLPNASHLPWLDAPIEFTSVLLSFLRGLDDAEAGQDPI
jgi:proline iminopeptidase